MGPLPRAPGRRATAVAPRSIAPVLAIAALLAAGCGRADVTPVPRYEVQVGAEPTEDAWRPAVPGDPAPVRAGGRLWMRVVPPPLDVPDLAVAAGAVHFVEAARVGDRTLTGPPLVVRVPPGEALLFARGTDHAVRLPPFLAGSERALWAHLLATEVPAVVIAGAMMLGGAFLLAVSLGARDRRSLRGLGLFLGALGLLELLVQRIVVVAWPLAWPSAYALSEAATMIYPVGFADFALGALGDGRRRIGRRLLAVTIAFAVAAPAAHLAGVVDISVSRQLASLLVLAVGVHAIALAARGARRGDPFARTFLVGIGALFVIALPEILDAANLVDVRAPTALYGVLAFGGAMTALVVRRTDEARARAEVAAAELSEKVGALERQNREIDTLNRELRHQIAERSKQLAESIEGTAGGPGLVRPLGEGDVIGDRYRVVRRIGQGGMGAVFEVVRLSDDRRFALKVMTSFETPLSAARFAREAEIAARIVHEAVVGIVDVGGRLDEGLYLVMELVRGQSLDEARDRYGDVPWAMGVLVAVARGLAALHAAGVVHRDLKPSNVLISTGDDGAPRAKISDFGISRRHEGPEDDLGAAEGDAPRSRPAIPLELQATAAAGPIGAMPGGGRLTATGVMVGTPAWMAPELAAGSRAARPASDVFAFGIVAYELLSGRPPFRDPPLFDALLGRPIAPVAPLPSAIAPRVAEIVQRCLAEVPRDRPTADEIVVALEAAAAPIA